MHISQSTDGRVFWRVLDDVRQVQGASSVYELACEAIAANSRLADVIAAHGLGESVDLLALLEAGQLDCPLRHPQPSSMHLTGTGLTHLGSANTRDEMHVKAAEGPQSDSMKMFQMGLADGKPAAGTSGVAPEWFYKGNGHVAVAPSQALESPSFALDGGEEPEVAGCYVNGPDGTPWRVGFALSNEFSDHVTERQNYLYLAHSKLRPASFGPEILVDDLPSDIHGTSRILRDGNVLWEKPFLSGEDNMSHTVANLEHHHFKYRLFRQPGEVHIHMFGTATLSCQDEIKTQTGDVFEIEAADFGLVLRNPLGHEITDNCYQVGRL